MIYVFENPNNDASVVYDESTLTEQDKEKGIAIVQLPEPQTPEGKQAILKCRKLTNEIWYEYINKSIPQEQLLQDRIAALEKSNAEMTTLIATLLAPATP